MHPHLYSSGTALPEDSAEAHASSTTQRVCVCVCVVFVSVVCAVSVCVSVRFFVCVSVCLCVCERAFLLKLNLCSPAGTFAVHRRVVHPIDLRNGAEVACWSGRTAEEVSYEEGHGVSEREAQQSSQSQHERVCGSLSG